MEGSPAANGIAASEMKQSPMIALTGAVFLSLSVNLFLNTHEAMAIAIGGTIPPTITAAIDPCNLRPSGMLKKLYQIHMLLC